MRPAPPIRRLSLLPCKPICSSSFLLPCGHHPVLVLHCSPGTFPNIMAKGKTMGPVVRSAVVGGWEEEGRQGEHGSCGGREATLSDTVVVGACPDALIQIHRTCAPREHPDVICGLWVMVVCLWRLVHHKRYTTRCGHGSQGRLSPHASRGKMGSLSASLSVLL